MTDSLSLYPIVILEDRYTGTYGGGAWIAIANADRKVKGTNRIVHCMMDGPSAGDPQAIAFWANPPDWIAVGSTPDEAKAALVEKLVGDV